MREQQVGSRFRIGQSTAADWRTAVDDCLREAMPLPPGANIGFAYATDHFAKDAGAILDRLRQGTGIEAILGTVGFGVCAGTSEHFDRPALALMAGSVPAASFSLFDRPDKAPRGWFGVVHCDPQAPALAEIMSDLGDATGAYLVGGLTASRGPRPQFAGGLAGGSVSGVVFSDAVPVITGLTQGCMPIGPMHRIGECEGNVIATLDDRPAFEVLRSDIERDASGDLGRLGDAIMVALPVSGADRPDYLVRNLMGVDARSGLVAVAAMVEPDQPMMFCRRDRTAAEADLDRLLDDLRRRSAGRTARGALYYSCVARGPNMFGRGDRELGRIAAALGDVPLVGFFCGGEISNSRLYGYTGVLSLFL